MRRPLRSRVLPGVLAVALALGVALPATAASAAPGAFEIVGTVLDHEGNPEAGVEVRGTTQGGSPSQPGYQDETDTTDVDGRFELTGLTADTLRVTFTKWPISSWEYRVVERVVTVGPATPSVRADVTLELAPADTVTVSGTVLDRTTGNPVGGANINLAFEVDGYHGFREVTADASGDYSIGMPALAAGAYATVNVRGPETWHPSYAGIAYEPGYYRVAVRGDVHRDLRLSRVITGTGSVSGVVRLASGSEFTGGFASLSPMNGGLSGMPASLSSTAGSAAFAFSSLRDGAYQLTVNVPGAKYYATRLVVSGGAIVVPPITLGEYATGTASVSGRVVDTRTGAPVVGAQIFGYAPEAAPLSTNTGADGRWTISDLPAGTVNVSVITNMLTPPAGALGYREFSVYRDVAVGAGEHVTGVELPITSIVPGTSVLNGRIRDGATYLPVAGASVEIEFMSVSLPSIQVTTDASGRFSATGLPEGKFYVTVTAPGYREKWASVDVVGAGASVVLPITPTGRSSTGFDDGTIGVTVLDLGGDPVDDVRVTVDTPGDPPVGYWDGFVDGDGEFTFTDIPEGTWRVSALPGGPGATLRVFEQASVEIAGGTAESASVVLEEILPRSIGGTIELGDFRASGLWISLTDPEGAFVNAAEVQEDGSYLIQNVAAGDYKITLSPGDGPTSGGYVEGSGGEVPDIGAAQLWWAGWRSGPGSASLQSPYASDAVVVEVGEGEALEGYDFEAVPGGTVRAAVRLADGTGTANLPPARCFSLVVYRSSGSGWAEVRNVQDFACGAEPLVLRGLGDGTYRFAVVDEFTGSTAFRTAYNGGAATLATAPSVRVEAGEVVDLGTVVVRIPKPDESSLEAIDLDFLASNGIDLGDYEDEIALADGDPTAGQPSDVEVGEEFAGQWVNVSLNSTPIVVGSSWHQVSPDGTVTVTMPTGLDGEHRLAVADSEGRLVGWTGVTIAEGAATGGTGGSVVKPRPGSAPAAVATPTPTPTPTPTATRTPHPVEPEEQPEAEPETAASTDDGSWAIWLFAGIGGLVLLVAVGVVIFRRRTA